MTDDKKTRGIPYESVAIDDYAYFTSSPNDNKHPEPDTNAMCDECKLPYGVYGLDGEVLLTVTF